MKILGYHYTLRRDLSYSELGAMGRVCVDQLIISIDRKVSDEQAKSTVLHEILEALNRHLDLQLSHQTVASLESSLYQILTENGVDLSPLLKTEEVKV